MPATEVKFPSEDASESFYYQYKDGRSVTVRIERRPNGRYALDLRHPMGGGRIAIKKPGTKQGVKSLREARMYAPFLLTPFFEGQPTGVLELPKNSTMKGQVELHLAAKKGSNKYGPETLKQAELAITRLLEIAYEHLGVRRLEDLQRIHVSQLVAHLRKRSNKRGDPLSNRYIRQQLMYLSGLYTWAVDMGLVKANPLARNGDIPPMPAGSDRAWLEPSEAQAMLDTVRNAPHHHSPHLFYIMAVQLYTGMTPKECLGLMVADVDWQIMKINVQPHPHRRLKNAHRKRWIPLPPRLAEYLREHIAKHGVPAYGLLFPRPGVGQEAGAAREGAMWKCVRAGTTAAARRAGIERVITPYVFRHTFCSVRLCMVEELPDGRGFVPVSRETVEDEMGHGSSEMVMTIYRHPLRERNKHRQTVLDYEAMRATPE